MQIRYQMYFSVTLITLPIMYSNHNVFYYAYFTPIVGITSIENGLRFLRRTALLQVDPWELYLVSYFMVDPITMNTLQDDVRATQINFMLSQ